MSLRLVTRISGTMPEPKVKHYSGPPPELTDGTDTRERMDWPALLLIEKKKDGVFLFRFTAEGRCVGDTWHQTVDEAQQQAKFEFENLLSDWKIVPAEVSDVIAFGVNAT